jgi:hypothetical protein
MGLFDIFKKKPQMPAKIEEGMQSQAIDFIDAFRGDRSPIDANKLDYSEQSLALVDKVLQDFYLQKAELPDDLHFLSSAYVFECARKNYGGRYLRSDAPNPFVLLIGEPDCEIGFCAMEKISMRAANGPDDSILFFYQGIEGLLKSKKSATLI